MAKTQNFQNHVRYYPLVHFFLMPILLLNLIWHSVRMYQEPSWDRAENILLAVGLIALALAARLQALKAQDRVIRLEESLRYRALLPADLADQASNLSLDKMLALRFASDAELAELVRRALANEFEKTKEIKQSVKNWRGDHLRV